MKLTAKEAVEKSIELWEWLAETGETKWDWPEWKHNGGKYSQVSFLCFLCEFVGYSPENRISCESCPYFIKYKARCFWDNQPFAKWENNMEWGEEDVKITQKYAKQFLKKLKAILKDMEAK